MTQTRRSARRQAASRRRKGADARTGITGTRPELARSARSAGAAGNAVIPLRQAGAGLGAWDRDQRYARQAGADSSGYELTGPQRKRRSGKVRHAVARRGMSGTRSAPGLSGNPARRSAQLSERYHRRLESLKLAIDSGNYFGVTAWRW